MIYKKDDIDMSLVSSTYEEQEGYISIEDEYTNNVLKMAGYSDIDEDCYIDLCVDKILVDKLEPYALKSPKCSFWCAIYVLDGRFELGESAIATDAHFSYWYAFEVIDGRFELGEPSIATDPKYKTKYEERFGVKL